MRVWRFHLPFALAALAIAGTEAAAQTPPAPACVALTIPSVQGVDDSTGFATAVRDLFASYLKGPTLQTVSLESRLTSQALVEARGQKCGQVLLVTLVQKRSNGSSMGRIVGQAAGSAVARAPVYGGVAGGAVASSATWAGGEAIYRYASEVHAKDELELSYRLGTADAVEQAKTVTFKAKAKSNGEDILTPLVEKASNGIAASALGGGR